MPTYEHACDDCQIVFDDVRPMSLSSEQAVCPQCGKKCGRAYVTVPSFTPDYEDFSDKNGGKGLYAPYVASRPNDPKAYCRNLRELRDKVREKGVEKHVGFESRNPGSGLRRRSL